MHSRRPSAYKPASSQIPAAAAILLLGFALRVWRIDAHALSGDEAFSIINWTRTSLPHLLNTIALIDPQPPITLISFYAWVRLVGDTELAARMLSALSSTLTIAAVYSISRRLFSSRVALTAALLCAANPYQIWYSQDIRSYALWMAASATTLLLLLRTVDSPQRFSRWAAYVIATALSVYTFYLELFTLVVHNLYFLWQLRTNRKVLKPWILSQSAIALLLLPWFGRPRLWQSGYQPTGGTAQPIRAFIVLLFGNTLPSAAVPNSDFIAGIAALVVIVTAFTILWRRYSTRQALFLTLTATLPVILLSVLAVFTHKGYFNPRYVSASSVPLIIIVAAALNLFSAQNQASLRKYTLLIPVTLLTALYVQSLAHYHFDPQSAKSPPWPDIVTVLQEQTGPDDIIIRNFPDPAFDYYYQGTTTTETLPHTANAPAAETTEHLERISLQYQYLWFLPVDSAAFDRERTVASWLNSNMALISDQWVGNARILEYAAWETVPSDYTALPSIQFDGVIELIGYRITPPPQHWSPGARVTLELVWQPLEPTDKPLTVFVHLVGPPGPNGSILWAQDDHLPQNGRIDSTTWAPGTIFRDVYHIELPLAAHPDPYFITAGLYNPSGERIDLEREDSVDDNAATILQLTLP